MPRIAPGGRGRSKLCRKVQRVLIYLVVPLFLPRKSNFSSQQENPLTKFMRRRHSHSAKECVGDLENRKYREIGSGTKRRFSLTRCKFPNDVVAQLNNVLRSHNVLAPDAAFVNLDEAPRFREGEQIGRRLLRVAGQRFCVILPVQIEEGIAEQEGSVW